MRRSGELAKWPAVQPIQGERNAFVDMLTDHHPKAERIRSPGVRSMKDPKLMLSVAQAIEERADWTRTIQGVSVGMWFAVAVRPGACGSLLSGMAAMYFPETAVFGDPGKAFYAAVQEALVMS